MFSDRSVSTALAEVESSQAEEGNEVMAKDNSCPPSNRVSAARSKKPCEGKKESKSSYPARMAMSFILDRETLDALAEIEARMGERRWETVPRLIRLERARLRKEEATKNGTPKT